MIILYAKIFLCVTRFLAKGDNTIGQAALWLLAQEGIQAQPQPHNDPPGASGQPLYLIEEVSE